MSEIDKMLDNMSDDDIALYLGGESPEEEHVVIDSDRKIIVPDSLKRIAVQHDHDIETVTFDCPRYWDGHDLSKMMVYVNHLCPSGALGCTVATNVTVDSTNSDIMHFDWTISECVTMAEGHITFLVCAKTQDEDGTNRHHWNSEICRDMYVSEGLELPDDFMETYPDVLTQVLLFNQNVLELQKTTMQRSAVYVGTDTVPDGYNVWINPSGDNVTTDPSGGGSSGSSTVDGALSSTSENPVQNKIVTAALAKKITAPATAAVGQIIKVKSVDTSGKPTEWECADVGEKWELITSGTVAEDASLTVNKDSNGKTFELKSCQVVIDGTVAGSGSTYMRFSVSDVNNNYHSVEMPLKKDNPTIKAVYYCVNGEVPMLFWEQDVGTTNWRSNENSCQFGLNGNQSYVLDILQHKVTLIYIGNYMGTGKLGTGTKYKIYGVRA